MEVPAIMFYWICLHLLLSGILVCHYLSFFSFWFWYQGNAGLEVSLEVFLFNFLKQFEKIGVNFCF